MSERKNAARFGWQRTGVRVVTTLLTLGMMVLIFCFSMEDADRSDRTSGQISMVVIHAAYPDYEREQPSVKRRIYDSVQHVVRKTAHFSEYALLGLLMRFCLESWFGDRKRNGLLSWGLATLYAGTDELHQQLIDGRAGQWPDVLIDSCGAAVGVLIATLLLRLWKKKMELPAGSMPGKD